MKTFSALLALSEGNPPVDYPHKGQWRGALMVSLICAWTSGWVSNRDAGDLRRLPESWQPRIILVAVIFLNCPFTTGSGFFVSFTCFLLFRVKFSMEIQIFIFSKIGLYQQNLVVSSKHLSELSLAAILLGLNMSWSRNQSQVKYFIDRPHAPTSATIRIITTK